MYQSAHYSASKTTSKSASLMGFLINSQPMPENPLKFRSSQQRYSEKFGPTHVGINLWLPGV